jgi:hypothetical protein
MNSDCWAEIAIYLLPGVALVIVTGVHVWLFYKSQRMDRAPVIEHELTLKYKDGKIIMFGFLLNTGRGSASVYSAVLDEEERGLNFLLIPVHAHIEKIERRIGPSTDIQEDKPISFTASTPLKERLKLKILYKDINGNECSTSCEYTKEGSDSYVINRSSFRIKV